MADQFLDKEKKKMNAEQIARVCHETNRAYCESIGDHSQLPWEQAEEWQRLSAMKGVQFALDNPAAPSSRRISKAMIPPPRRPSRGPRWACRLSDDDLFLCTPWFAGWASFGGPRIATAEYWWGVELYWKRSASPREGENPFMRSWAVEFRRYSRRQAVQMGGLP